MHGENFQEDLKPKNYINLINPEGIFLSIDKCEWKEFIEFLKMILFYTC